MKLPSIIQYSETIANPFGLFHTLGDFEVERDCYNEIRLYAGRSAVVFKLWCNDRAFALKCFLKAPRSANMIYEHLVAGNSDIILPVRYLADEIFVYDFNGKGEYYSVALRDWAHGETMDKLIRRAAMESDKKTLAKMAAEFDILASKLLHQDWAHGDLKPENMVVDENMKIHLIDYDAVYIPAFEGMQTIEIGTTPYQHPARDCNYFDNTIDNYSIAIISVSLHALADQPLLYSRYNNGDNIILNPSDILAGTSELYNNLKTLYKDQGRDDLHALTLALSEGTPQLSVVETVFK